MKDTLEIIRSNLMAGIGIFSGSLVLGFYRRGTVLGTTLVFIAVLTLLAMILMFLRLHRHKRVSRHATRLRPHGHVVPGYTTAESIDLTLAAQASVKGFRPRGGTPIAITADNKSIELWVGVEATARITIPRFKVTQIDVFPGTLRKRPIQALGVRTDTTGILFVPAYTPILNRTRSDTAGFTRAKSTLNRE